MNTSDPTEAKPQQNGPPQESEPTKTESAIDSNYSLRQSFFIITFRLIVLESVFALLFWLIYWFAPLPSPDQVFLFNVIFWTLQGVNFFCILMVLLVWYSHYYVIAPNAILRSWGVIYRQTVTCDIPSIRSVKVRQNLLQRLLNYGTIELESPLLEDHFIITKVQKPYKHAKLIDFQRLELLENGRVGEITPVISKIP